MLMSGTTHCEQDFEPKWLYIKYDELLTDNGVNKSK